MIPSAILQSLAGEELALTIPGFRRDLVFVEDVLQAYLLALDGARKTWGKIINIGSGQQWSNEAVVELIQATTGRAITVRQGAYPSRASDTEHWVADIRRAESLLGWQPRHSLRSGLEKTVAWFRARPELAKHYLKKAN